MEAEGGGRKGMRNRRGTGQQTLGRCRWNADWMVEVLCGAGWYAVALQGGAIRLSPSNDSG